MKKLLLLLMFGVVSSLSFSQVQVGNGTVVGQALPLEPFFGYTYSQSIYLQPEINATGNITGIQYYFAGSSLSNTDSITIYMAHTSRTSFSSTTDWEPIASFTQVFKGTIPDPGTAGWVSITLTTPFNYNNVDNLIVAIEDDRAGYNTSSDDFYCEATPGNRSIVYRNDNTNPDPALPPTASGLRAYIPNTIFDGITQTCPSVSALNAYNVTRDSVYLTWTNGLNDSAWIIEYGTTGFSLGTGTTVNHPNDTLFIDGLTPNTGYDIYVRSICTVGDSSPWVGPLNITTLLSCPAPTFSLVDQTTTTISVVVSPAAYDSVYIIEYDTTGYTYGTGTTITSTNDTIVITGLTANSTYDVYLKSVCSLGDTSLLVGSVTTNTTCGVLTAYWIDDVEGHLPTLNSSIANCWSSSPTGTTSSYRWNVDASASTPSSSTGPSGAYSGSSYFYSEASEGSAGDSAILTSPMIDVSSLSAPSLSFYYHMYGSTMGDLYVDVYDSAGWHHAVWSVSGQQQTAAGDPWLQAIVDLASFGDTVQVRFVAVRSTNFYGDISLDDIAFEEGPSCFDPSGLISLNVLSDSVDLTWNSNSTDSVYLIQYGPAGFPIGYGTVVSSLNDTTGVGSLAADTDYDFYVRAVCSLGDSSAWIGPLSLKTECTTIIAPWLEDVEANTATTNSTMDNCWSSNPTGTTSNYRWNVDASGSTPSTSTGPSGAYSGSNYFYVEATSGSAGDTAQLLATKVDVSALTSPFLSFYYHMYGSGMGNLYVDVYDGSTWHLAIDSIIGQQQTSLTDPWKQKYVDLTTYGNLVQVRFTAVKGSSGLGDISIDDILVDEEPTCYKPISLSAFNIDDDSVYLAWDTLSTDSLYQIQYGVTGFGLGTGMLADTTSDTTVITGLMPATTYDFYIRNICTIGDTSDWYGPITLTTLCPDSGFIPSYLQDFTDYLPLCWEEAAGVITDSTVLTYGASNWLADGFSNVGTTGAANVTISGTTVDEWLISPSINLGNGSINYQLEFDVSMTVNGSTAADTMQYDDTLMLVISTDNGITWADTNALMIWGDGTEPSATGDHIIIPLSGYTGNVKFAYYAESSVSGENIEVFVDNFWVREVPVCLEPDSIYTVFVGEDTAVLTWNQGPADSTWLIEYGLAGFTQGTGMLDTLITDTAFLNGLTGNTSYDFYLRSVCTSLDTSIWVGPFTFKTTCPAVFMSPYYDSVEDHTPVTNADIANCWTTTPTVTTSAFRWNVDGSGSTPSSSTGPSGANSGTNYFYTEASSGSDGDSAILTSPMVDVTSLTIPALSFNYHMYGSTMGTLYVDVFDGTTWNRGVWFKSGQQQTSAGAPWEPAIIDLSAYGDTVQFRFRAVRVGSGGSDYFGDISIDDIAVEEGPSCFDPSAFTAYYVGYDSVGLTWNASSTDSVYNVQYGLSGFPIGTGATVQVSNDTAGIAGLLDNTNYDFYVRTICSISDTTVWVGPITITTLCAPIVAPWIDSVETHTAVTNADIANCWSTSPSITTSDYRWNVDASGSTPTGSTGPSGANSGVKYFYTEASSGTTGDSAILVSPLMDVSSLTISALSFNYHMYGSSMGSLHVDVYDGTTWTRDVWSKTGQQQTATGDAWRNGLVDLRPYGNDIQVRFRAYKGSGIYGDISLDDIGFIEGPNCFDPTSISTFYATFDSIGVTYTGSLSDSVYLIEYGPVGFTPGTGTTVSTTNDSIYVSGLNADTEYDFYVRSICTGGDTSVYVGPANDTTLPLCVRAVSFTVLGTDSTSANLGWNLDPTHASFIIEYGPAGFALGTGTVVTVTAPTNFYTATGLSPQTTYDFYIRAVCLSNDTSAWDGPFQGTTDCSTQPLPWREGFENLPAYGTGDVPLCWLEDGDWVTDSNTNTRNRMARTDSGYMYTNWSANDWVFTPYFNMDTSGLYVFSFWYITDGAAVWDSLRVGVGTNQASGAMTNILAVQTGVINTNYQEMKVYYKPTVAGNYTFGIHVASNISPWYMTFDDFWLDDTTQWIGTPELAGLESFEIYPNPNNGEFNLRNKGASKTSVVSVMDIQGRKVYENNLYLAEGAQTKINLSQIERGVYMVLINTDGVLEQYKIVIE